MKRSPQTGAAGINWGEIIADRTYDKIIESRDADPALFTKEEKKRSRPVNSLQSNPISYLTLTLRLPYGYKS
jgi:hypothetical protein